MRRYFYIASVLICCLSTSHAQDIVNNVGSNVFFNSEYCPATLYSGEKHVYRGLKIKLNLSNGQVLFIKENSDEVELTISFTIRKIEFGNCGKATANAVFKTGYPPAGVQDKNSFYQVLDSGSTQLLKSIRVVMKDADKKYEYGVKEDPVFEKWEAYYLYNPSIGMVKVGRSKEAMINALENKKAAVEQFITDNNIRFRNDEDMARVVAFYNSAR